MACDGHSVEGSGCGEEETVASAEDGCHDKCVYDVWQDVNLEALHGDDIWPSHY